MPSAMNLASVPSDPLLTICIPTFNRARLLEHALGKLQEHAPSFDISFEIVVSDNASPDDTQEVIKRFSRDLPIRAFRQNETVPAFANFEFAMDKGRGKFLTYLADDDELLLPALAAAIRAMEAAPDVGFCCAPWLLGPVNEVPKSVFFRIQKDLYWRRGEFVPALQDILRWRIWPEIGIWRSDIFHIVQPRERKHAYWAFSNTSDILRHASVLVRKDPFYHSITNHLVSRSSDTVGAVETMEAWDRYRGGLEYFMGAAGNIVDDELRNRLVSEMTPFIGDRLAVAVRMRSNRDADPLVTYDLAIRARGLGFSKQVAPFMKQVAVRAALHFLTTDEKINFGVERLIFVGVSNDAFRNKMRAICPKPVEWFEAPGSIPMADGALVCILNSAKVSKDELDRLAKSAQRIVFEKDIVARFPV